jgi:hypothetical protein
MHKFLDAYDLPKLIQEYVNHLNRSMTNNNIERVIVSQERKSQYQMDSLPNSTKSADKN